VANAALQQVTALRGDFDGMKSGVELHVKSTVKAELDPIRVSLARQDTTLAQILDFSEKAAERAHRMKLDTLDEEIKVEDLRSKKVANRHAIEIDPRIDGTHKRRIAWAMAIAAIITAIGTLFGLSAASHGHAAPTAEPVDSHH